MERFRRWFRRSMPIHLTAGTRAHKASVTIFSWGVDIAAGGRRTLTVTWRPLAAHLSPDGTPGHEAASQLWPRRRARRGFGGG